MKQTLIKTKMPPIPENLSMIAAIIKSDWKNWNSAAGPHVVVMSRLNTMNDFDGKESARSAVRYFLNNARSWRGKVADAVKAKLSEMVNGA